MWPLGVLKQPNFIGVAVDLDFNTFPFVDLTTRHAVNNTNVTQVSNKAFFNNPNNNSLARLEVVNRLKDFNLQTDFDLTFTFNVQTFVGKSDQVLVSLLDGLGNSLIEVFLNPDGKLRTHFVQENVISLLSSTGLITGGLDFDFKLGRRASTVKMYCNNIEIATGIITARYNIARKLILGARADINGYGLYGTIDNFKFESFIS